MTATQNRALGASRGSLQPHPITTTPKQTNRAITPSPVADEGGAERSKAEGVFASKQDTTSPEPTAHKLNPQTNPAHKTTNEKPIPTLPENKNLSRFMDAFLDGSFSIPAICTEFELTLDELLALLESPRMQDAFAIFNKIAKTREETIAAQARVAATHRLAELATWPHAADPVEARACETARKAASQILRTTQATKPPRQPREPAQHQPSSTPTQAANCTPIKHETQSSKPPNPIPHLAKKHRRRRTWALPLFFLACCLMQAPRSPLKPGGWLARRDVTVSKTPYPLATTHTNSIHNPVHPQMGPA